MEATVAHVSFGWMTYVVLHTKGSELLKFKPCREVGTGVALVITEVATVVEDILTKDRVVVTLEVIEVETILEDILTEDGVVVKCVDMEVVDVGFERLFVGLVMLVIFEDEVTLVEVEYSVEVEVDVQVTGLLRMQST